MGITTYRKVIAGKTEILYLVVAEAINRYTGKRVQKKRRSIPSKPKAQHIYKELWSMCREERPDGAHLKRWDELVGRYLLYLDGKIRSIENPLPITSSKKSNAFFPTLFILVR